LPAAFGQTGYEYTLRFAAHDGDTPDTPATVRGSFFVRALSLIMIYDTNVRARRGASECINRMARREAVTRRDADLATFLSSHVSGVGPLLLPFLLSLFFFLLPTEKKVVTVVTASHATAAVSKKRTRIRVTPRLSASRRPKTCQTVSWPPHRSRISITLRLGSNCTL
jgi:hypothetical protein